MERLHCTRNASHADTSGLNYSVTSTYPDLDCVFMNSGIQRKLDFSEPAEVDLEMVEMEFRTNYLSYLALTKGFLPFLQKKKEESSIV